jgi:diguanylate cyclase (GGDEF)-like protein
MAARTRNALDHHAVTDDVGIPEAVDCRAKSTRERTVGGGSRSDHDETAMNDNMANHDPNASKAPEFPTARAGMGFDEASAAVVDYLKSVLPMGFWAVTRFDGLRQLYLEVRDDSYGLGPGGSHLWEDSFCINMVAGKTPKIAPDAMKIPEYAASGVAQAIDIGAYVGIPITQPDGELFGTLCGLDPAPQSDDMLQHAPLLDIFGLLLSTILAADLDRTRQARELEQAELAAESDQMTGLFNRRGWNRYMEIEEARFRRFGDPGAVIVIDLDGLKEVNDTEGHPAGDELIKTAGRVISETIRDSDIAARLGGDEFGIIANSVAPADCDLLVARILDGFRAAGVSGSVGHAPYTVVAGFPGAFAEADASMYAEKQRRRAARAASS